MMINFTGVHNQIQTSETSASDLLKILNFTETLISQFTMPSATLFIITPENIFFTIDTSKFGANVVINCNINETLEFIEAHHSVYLLLYTNVSMDVKESLPQFISWTNFKHETLYILYFDEFVNEEEYDIAHRLAEIFDDCWSLYILNVVLVYRSSRSQSIKWFNHDVFLNITYNRTGDFNLTTYKSTINTNLNGYQLKACFYNVFPYSLVLKNDSGGIFVSGSDGYGMMTMLKSMNATHKLIITSSNGSRLLNSRKDLENHVCDILFTSQFMSDVDHVEFLYPMAMDSWCVLVPKEGANSDVIKLLLPFSASVWCVFTICIVIIFAFSLVFFKFVFTMDGRDQSVLIMVFDVFRIILNSSVPTRRHKQSLSVKIFMASLVFYSFLISSVYLALLVGFLLQPLYHKDMHTLNEVYNSGLKIMAVKEKFLLWLDAGLGESDWITSIIKPTTDPNFKKNLHGNNLNYGYTVRHRMATYFIQLDEHYRNGRPVYHLVEECYLPVYASFAVHTSFPFQKLVDRTQLRINEAGLGKYWDVLSRYEIKLYTKSHLAKPEHNHEEAIPLSLSHLQGIFFALIIGIIISCFVFVGEYFAEHNKFLVN